VRSVLSMGNPGLWSSRWCPDAEVALPALCCFLLWPGLRLTEQPTRAVDDHERKRAQVERVAITARSWLAFMSRSPHGFLEHD
jgi:hypothetical protein